MTHRLQRCSAKAEVGEVSSKTIPNSLEVDLAPSNLSARSYRRFHGAIQVFGPGRVVAHLRQDVRNTPAGLRQQKLTISCGHQRIIRKQKRLPSEAEPHRLQTNFWPASVNMNQGFT